MYIYTEAQQLVDPLHPSRARYQARAGVTYARTRALLSSPVLTCAVVIGCAVGAAMREGLFYS